jgi:hypothetical protein
MLHNLCSNDNPCNGDFDCIGDVDEDDNAIFYMDFGWKKQKSLFFV